MGIYLAHGVGSVYESPLPLGLYLLGAAATVVASFVLRAVVTPREELGPERRIAGEVAVLVLSRVGKALALIALMLTMATGALTAEEGLSLASLLFWVGLIVATTFACCILHGLWEAVDPWATIESSYRVGAPAAAAPEPAWWVGPLALYGLFWFELVSGVGFDPFWILVVLHLYSLVALSLRARIGDGWPSVDPLSILFGFAERVAPLRMDSDGLFYRGLRGLYVDREMPLALYASVFVLLGSTTLDNVRTTEGWSRMRHALSLDVVPDRLFDSLALVLLAFGFLLPFLAAVALGMRSTAREPVAAAARRLGWSLVPIGVAYLLAHNASLLITGIPQIVRSLSDPFERGWNLFGTVDAFRSYLPSPAIVWWIEIVLIVGGHILGVLAAHRTAARLAGSHSAAVRSQYALTALMSLFTISTLWLLSQPLVT